MYSTICQRSPQCSTWGWRRNPGPCGQADRCKGKLFYSYRSMAGIALAYEYTHVM